MNVNEYLVTKTRRDEKVTVLKHNISMEVAKSVHHQYLPKRYPKKYSLRLETHVKALKITEGDRTACSE